MGARVKAYDPVAMQACHAQHPELRIRYCDTPAELAEDADALVLVTEWNEFRELDLADLAKRMVSPILVDGRNLYAPDAVAAAGFDYIGVGRALRRAQQGTTADVMQSRR